MVVAAANVGIKIFPAPRLIVANHKADLPQN
jgi:hypothetical protein